MPKKSDFDCINNIILYPNIESILHFNIRRYTDYYNGIKMLDKKCYVKNPDESLIPIETFLYDKENGYYEAQYVITNPAKSQKYTFRICPFDYSINQKIIEKTGSWSIVHSYLMILLRYQKKLSSFENMMKVYDNIHIKYWSVNEYRRNYIVNENDKKNFFLEFLNLDLEIDNNNSDCYYLNQTPTIFSNRFEIELLHNIYNLNINNKMHNCIKFLWENINVNIKNEFEQIQREKSHDNIQYVEFEKDFIENFFNCKTELFFKKKASVLEDFIKNIPESIYKKFLNRDDNEDNDNEDEDNGNEDDLEYIFCNIYDEVFDISEDNDKYFFGESICQKNILILNFRNFVIMKIVEGEKLAEDNKYIDIDELDIFVHNYLTCANTYENDNCENGCDCKTDDSLRKRMRQFIDFNNDNDSNRFKINGKINKITNKMEQNESKYMSIINELSAKNKELTNKIEQNESKYMALINKMEQNESEYMTLINELSTKNKEITNKMEQNESKYIALIMNYLQRIKK